jgi:membrane associated rhomboid family serine protease
MSANKVFLLLTLLLGTTSSLVQIETSLRQPSRAGFQMIDVKADPTSLLGHRRHFSTRLGGKRWMPEWDGDDIRLLSRLRRRLKRSDLGISTSRSKSALIAMNWLLFLYQTITTVNFIRKRNRSYWPRHALSIISDVLMGASVKGPMKMDFCFSNSLANLQPHRYLTSGFIHQSIVHFLINMIAIRNQPSWLAMGLGGPLYLTTYLVSIVTGNLAHLWYIQNPFDRSLALGASGAIGGIYGLMYVQLTRMEGGKGLFRALKGMTLLFLLGTLIENVSPISQFGGFLGGALVGILCAPSYAKSYALRRKNSAEYDSLSSDYRQEVGYGIMPTRRGWIPLPLLWAVLALLLATADNKFRMIPAKILKGLLAPGSLSR